MDNTLIRDGKVWNICLKGCDITITKKSPNYLSDIKRINISCSNFSSASVYYQSKIKRKIEKGYTNQTTIEPYQLYVQQISQYTKQSNEEASKYQAQFQGEYLVSAHDRYFALTISGNVITTETMVQGYTNRKKKVCDTNTQEIAIHMIDQKIAEGYWRDTAQYNKWLETDKEKESGNDDGTEPILNDYDELLHETLEDLNQRYG